MSSNLAKARMVQYGPSLSMYFDGLLSGINTQEEVHYLAEEVISLLEQRFLKRVNGSPYMPRAAHQEFPANHSVSI